MDRQDRNRLALSKKKYTRERKEEDKKKTG